jgi:hypothetical protein
MKVFTVKIAVFLFLVLGYYSGSAQTITVTASNNGLTTTAVGGASDIGIFGFEVARGSGSGGTTTKVQSFKIKLSKDPVGIFDTPRIFLSANNSFGGDVSIGTMTLSNPSADNYYYELTLEAADEITLAQSSSLFFFLVVNVDPDVIPADGPINAFIEADGDIVVSSAAGNTGTPAGPNINFTQLTATIGSLNAPANNVAASPLTASASEQAVFGFSLQSNGSQTLTALAIQFTETPIGKYSDYTLVPSNDADFSTPNSTPIAGLTFTPSATQLTITGLDESITSSTKYYFLVVNVEGGVTAATDPIQASLGASNLTLTGYATGSATGVDYSFIGLTTTLEQITGGIASSPLASNSTENAILGFSIVSNGNPNLTALTIELTSNANGKFTNVKLYESANNTFGGDAEIVDPGGYTVTLTNTEPFRIQFTNLAQALSTTPRYYFVVADVTPTVNASTPTIQPSFNVSNVTVSGGGDVIVTDAPVTGTEYSFVDNVPPLVTTFNPPDNQTNVTIHLNQLIITFNESINNIGTGLNDDNNIRIRNVTDNTVHETIDPTAVGRVTISGGGNDMVTITLTQPFEPNKQYAVRIGNSVFEDDSGNNYAGIINNTDWNFTIEDRPFITNSGGVSPLTTCIGEPVTLTGLRFVGTGNPPTGNLKPEVTVGGALVPEANITTFNATQIVFILPDNAVTGKITVKNMNSLLTSLESNETFTVKPAINTGLSTGTNITPAVNTNFQVLVGGATQTGVSYRVQRPNLTFTASQAGDGGQLSFGPFNHNTPGTYTYRVEASSAGCTTVFLTDVVVVIAELTADAGADRDLCAGQSTVLGGDPPGFGGTGFISYSWTSNPAGFTSSSPNPTVSPTVTTTYTLTITDDSGASNNSTVTITVNPAPAVSFQPVPPDTEVRTSYSLSDTYFELNASPSQLISDGATFFGPGVVSISDSNKYYFNPKFAGVSNSHTITYTFNDGTCSNSTTIIFSVSSNIITGLEDFYCRNETSSGNLEPSASTLNKISIERPGYSFSRLRFYYFGYHDFDASTDPLFRPNPGSEPNVYRMDIQKVNNIIANFGSGGTLYIDVFASNGISEILYTWQIFRIIDLGFPPEIMAGGIPLTEKFTVCSDATPITLASSNSDYTVNNFSITSGQSSAISGNDFIPQNLNFGEQIEMPLTISMNYDDINGCTNAVNRNFIAVNKPPAPLAPDVEYCQFADPPFPIFASGYGDNFLWYNTDPSGGSVTSIDRGPIFTSHGIDGQLATQQTFYVTQVYAGCEGDPEPTVIRIKSAPSATFTLPTICVDREFTLEGPMDTSDPGNPVPYTSYEWTFGNAVGSGQTVSHTYTSVNQFTITLSITSSEDCTNASSQQVTPGFNPIPDFTFNQVCEGDNTQFIATSNITVAQYAWDFGDGSTIERDITKSLNDAVPSPNQGTYKEPRHNFNAGTDNYEVTVTAYTGSGCYDSLTKVVGILEYLSFSTEDPYQMESLDGGKGFWTLEDINGNSSWEFEAPTTTIISSPEMTWVTNADGLYNSNERSFLNSPCLDISAIEKPVFSLHFNYSTQFQSDGAVLEFSKDGGLNWASLGLINSGLEWFNSTFFGNIGSSTLGWSGVDSSAIYVYGKQAIDNVAGLTSPSDRQKLRFRLAWATNSDGEFEGFAFNKVTIESRNRNLLVENFTNTSAPGHGTSQTAFTAIPDNEVVKLQYHVSFPGPDNINATNPLDPNARSAYYGINNSSNLIPRGYVDGYSNGPLAAPWDDDYRSKRALATSPLKILINTTQGNSDELSFTVTVDPITDMTATGIIPVLHAVIIEKDVSTNTFVVKKMLPHPAGTKLNTPLLVDDPPTEVSFTWRPDNSNFTKSEIAIVAFVQDEITKEVYQAAALLNPVQAHVPDPSIITGLEDPSFANKIQVYPNPANDEVNVVLPEPAQAQTPVVLMDAHGRVLYTGNFRAGQQQKTITTSEFAGGMYFLQITTKENVVRKKVMIVHRN